MPSGYWVFCSNACHQAVSNSLTGNRRGRKEEVILLMCDFWDQDVKRKGTFS